MKKKNTGDRLDVVPMVVFDNGLTDLFIINTEHLDPHAGMDVVQEFLAPLRIFTVKANCDAFHFLFFFIVFKPFLQNKIKKE